MTWYLWYLVFAISGGVMSHRVLYAPATRLALELNPSCICLTSPILTQAIWVILSAIVAPLLIIPILIPNKQEIFIITLAKVFASKNGEDENE
jgi:hypothetical protein